MTVEELITRLKEFPQDMPVAIGSNELLVVQKQRVCLSGEDHADGPRDVVQLDWFPF